MVATRETIEAYIRQKAGEMGIDPDIAVRVWQSEGMTGDPAEAWQSRVVSGGRREPSYGPYQFYMDGGMGNEFMRKTGLDPREPETWDEQVDYALETARKTGWAPWHGAKNTGISRWQGIGERGGSNVPIPTPRPQTLPYDDAPIPTPRPALAANVERPANFTLPEFGPIPTPRPEGLFGGNPPIPTPRPQRLPEFGPRPTPRPDTGKGGRVPTPDTRVQQGHSASGDILTYMNQNAIRSQPIVPELAARVSEAVQAVYGPGYRAQVYSGGQAPKGSGKKRTGSVRHDHGRAADIYIVGPDGKRVQGDALAPLGQYWAAKKYGGVGMEMSGGGIHLDAWETPPPGGSMHWNYADKGGAYTPAMQAAMQAGLKGELPKLFQQTADVAEFMKNNPQPGGFGLAGFKAGVETAAAPQPTPRPDTSAPLIGSAPQLGKSGTNPLGNLASALAGMGGGASMPPPQPIRTAPNTFHGGGSVSPVATPMGGGQDMQKLALIKALMGMA